MLRIILFSIIVVLFIIALAIFIKGFPKAATSSLPKYDGPLNFSRAVIHHTDGSDVPGRDFTIQEINRMHKERGFDMIGYHFLIRKDGTVHEGRPLSKLGAHAKGRNEYVGIALTGYDKFTDQQLDSLDILLFQLGIQRVERHHEKCPSNGIDVEAIKNRLDNFYAD